MGAWMLALSLLANTGNGQSVAVTALAPRHGVPADLADLLTDNLVKHIRDSGRFTRVVSAKEVQASLNFEMQKQLMTCGDTSCVAEVASAMGVDFLVTGAIGKVGNFWMVNASLISVRTGTASGQVSETIPATSEDTLLLAMPGIVEKLLAQVPSLAGAPPPHVTTVQEPLIFTPPPASDTAASQDEPTRSPSGSALGAAAVGAVCAGAAVVAAAGAFAGLSSSLAALVYFNTQKGADKQAVPLSVVWWSGWAFLAVNGGVALVAAVFATAGAIAAVALR